MKRRIAKMSFVRAQKYLWRLSLMDARDRQSLDSRITREKARAALHPSEQEHKEAEKAAERKIVAARKKANAAANAARRQSGKAGRVVFPSYSVVQY